MPRPLTELLRKNVVCEVSYITRPMWNGEREADIIRCYWTGAIDTWGKFTIVPLNGRPMLYLFADEIVEVEAL